MIKKAIFIFVIALINLMSSALAEGIGTGWSEPQTTFFEDCDDMAVDANGNLHVVYEDYDYFESEDIFIGTSYVKYMNSTSPVPEVIAKATYTVSPPGSDNISGDEVWNPLIAIDPNGNIHVIYGYFDYDFENYSIKYTTKQLAVPVILVHGWRGSPETWEMLRQKLDVEGIDYYGGRCTDYWGFG